ncbi:MAG: hypothetical protein GY931_00375 [Maribacter sp.]|nr:hypothetical protein [Maribacter sp.]
MAELSLRLTSAGIRPITLIWVAKYYPDITAYYFFVSYASPFFYKLASLSQLNVYRRRLNSNIRFEVVATDYYFLVLVRLLFLLLPAALLVGFFDFIGVKLLYLVIFAVCESYFLNREFVNLCLGQPVRSSISLFCLRSIQAVILVIVCLTNTDFSIFIVSYLAVTAVLFFGLVKSGNVFLGKKTVYRALRFGSYKKQLGVGLKELFSIGYFTLSTVMVSANTADFEKTKYFLVGFSLSGFVILILRVFFVNRIVPDLTKRFVPLRLLEVYIYIGFFMLVSAFSVGLVYFLGFEYSFLIYLGTSFAIFVISNIVGQRYLLYLSSRKIPSSYVYVNLISILFLSIFMPLVEAEVWYLSISVIAPMLVALVINILYTNLMKGKT